MTCRFGSPVEIHVGGNGPLLREAIAASARNFFHENSDLIQGRVLDFTGDYARGECGGYFETVICNGVLQRVGEPENTLRWAVSASLVTGGHALITYPAAGEQDGECDRWRFTRSGMERMLASACLKVLKHELLAMLALGDWRLPLLYGVVAQR